MVTCVTLKTYDIEWIYILFGFTVKHILSKCSKVLILKLDFINIFFQTVSSLKPFIFLSNVFDRFTFFTSEYDTTLEEDLNGDLDGYFRRLMVSLVCGARNENNFEIDEDLEEEDVNAFIEVSADMVVQVY